MRVLKILYVLSLSFIVSCSFGNSATVTISNESGQLLKQLQVGVFGKKKSIINLKNGESAVLVFRNLSDSHYTVNGELENSALFNGDFGYVIHGMDFTASFRLKEGGKIEFTSNAT